MSENTIQLPAPSKTGGMPLMEALSKRTSARDFSQMDLDIETLSNLLWATNGFNREHKRTAPSSHNRQELDVYVALRCGTYLYEAKEHSLKRVLDEDIRAVTGLQDFAAEAPVNLIFVSELSKITGKDERGTIETTFANTGFVSQNCYLYCASAGLNTVVRAMVDKKALALTLGLGATQIVTLVQSVGWPKGPRKVYAPLIPGLEKMNFSEMKSLLGEFGSRGAIDVVNWKEYPYQPEAHFNIARSLTHLFVKFQVREHELRAVNMEDNGSVWEDCCAEFFVQVPDSPFYFNFETNCIGTMLGAKRKSKTESTHFESDVLSRCIRYSSLEREPIECRSGDFEWELIIGIPFDILDLDGANLPEKLRANFYKCGDATSTPHFLSWNPILVATPNFHLPEFFGEIIFK